MDIYKIVPNKIENGISNCIIEKEIQGEWLLINFKFESGRKSSLKIKRFVDDKIFFFGLGLFAGEGFRSRRPSNIKRANAVEFVNSNPIFIQSFLDFLQGFGFAKEQFKSRIQISCDVYKSEKMREKSTNFWQRVTGIPIKNFKTPNIRIRKNSKQKSENGSLSIILYSQPLWRLLEFWTQNIKLSGSTQIFGF